MFTLTNIITINKHVSIMTSADLIMALLSLSPWSPSPWSPNHYHHHHSHLHQRQHIIVSLGSHLCIILSVIVVIMVTTAALTPFQWVLALCRAPCWALSTSYLTAPSKRTSVHGYPPFTDDGPMCQRGEIICPRWQNSHHSQYCIFRRIKIHPNDSRNFSFFLEIKEITRLRSHALWTGGCHESSKGDLGLLFSGDSCSLIQKGCSSFN